MLPIERKAYIINKLKHDQFVKVEDLSKELNVTLMTIRRDLTKLDEENLLVRTHGGAVLKSLLKDEEQYESKKKKNQFIKYKIAQEALKLIKDGDTILLDAGTTTYELAQLLENKENLTIVTGDLAIASSLFNKKHELYFAGGKVQKGTGAVYGPKSIEFIQDIHVDIAFIGASAVSEKDWFISTPTMEKAYLKSMMMKIARKSVMLCDKSKFGKENFAKIGSILELNVLITDKIFNKDECDYFRKKDLKIKTV